MLVFSYLFYNFLYPLYISDTIIIRYGLKPFDICQKNPDLWLYLKIIYIPFFIFSNLVLSNCIYNRLLKNLIQKILKSNNSDISKIIKNNTNKNDLQLLIGFDKETNLDIYVPESGLYQNFLITGTIGSGKTSSAMYPFTEQLIKYNAKNKENKIGMLILDVKGNYHLQVSNYLNKYGLSDDLITISLDSNATYNPLHKPNLNPAVLSNRLKTILTLFSENNSESYWLDKVEQILSECIKLCRLYNDGYVTFLEIHKLITYPSYYKEKIVKLRELFISSKLSQKDIYELNSALDFFEKEYYSLDQRTLSILKSEITRITNIFVSDYNISNTFCPKKENLTLLGFSDVIKEGKIVVLNMNISEYRNLSKVIAAYLKLDFQSEIMYNLSNNNIRRTAFICDEYSEYVTKNDCEFFSLSREAKCINIVSTQSYSSLKNTLKDETSVRVICQNLINKLWFRTDDIFTIEEAQKQLGKEDKEKTSHTISENAKETNFNYLTNSLNSKNSNISESINSYFQTDFKYDTNFFTQDLETFSTLSFLSNGTKILPPKKLIMYPYFK